MIAIISSGIYTTLQDTGRFGFRKYGVPISGPMDAVSANSANNLLNNDLNAALLEFTLQGAVLKFNHPAIIAITGATNSPTVNDESISINTPIKIAAGSMLKIGRCATGSFGYLAILGGFKGEKRLNSLAHYKGITANQRILKGESLFFSPHPNQDVPIDNKPTLINWKTNEIPAFKGPDFNMLDSQSTNLLSASNFIVSNEISRMGYRIDSERPIVAREIITAPVQPGTIQLTPSGKLIALMPDCQTTGGYARILQLSNKSRSILAQKRTGEHFSFNICD